MRFQDSAEFRAVIWNTWRTFPLRCNTVLRKTGVVRHPRTLNNYYVAAKHIVRVRQYLGCLYTVLVFPVRDRHLWDDCGRLVASGLCSVSVTARTFIDPKAELAYQVILCRRL
jgi:hypothetical protein